MKQKNRIKDSFSYIISEKIKVFQEKIILLEKLKMESKIEGPIQFSISDIIPDEQYNPQLKGLKTGVSKFHILEDLKGAYVYFFEIIEPVTTTGKLIDSLVKFKMSDCHDCNGNRRAMARIPKSFNDLSTDILYVGSIKNDLKKRIKEHIGYGSATTYAMQLKHWAPKELKLKLYYIKIENPELTTDIEAALSEHLNPLIGKREK